MDMLLALIANIIQQSSWELVGEIFSLLIIFCMIAVVVKWHFSKTSPINLADMFLDESGKIGSSKTRLNSAFIIASWAMIYMVVKGSLTEWYLAAYLAAFVYDRAQARKAE